MVEALRNVRRVAQALAGERQPPVVGIAAPHEGEGASFVAEALANVLTLGGRRVLLVRLSVETSPVESEEGRSAMPFDPAAALRLKGSIGPFEIDARPVAPLDALAYYTSRLFDDALGAARETYDAIVLDLPPGGRPSDVDPRGDRLDAFVAVIDPARTSRAALAQAADPDASGIVLNRVAPDPHGLLR